MARTLTELQKSIHYLMEGDTDVPASGEDDYEIRLNTINKWIRNWADEEGVLWNELWSMGEITSTGAGHYSLSSLSMRFPGGYVYYQEGESSPIYYRVEKLENIALLEGDSTPFVYFTGSPEGGYTLYFNPRSYPTGAGKIYIPYYAKPTELVNGSDTPQMLNPDYIVHGVISDLLSQENPSESDRHFALSQAKLRAMKVANMQSPWYNQNTIPDRLNKLSVSAFGV